MHVHPKREEHEVPSIAKRRVVKMYLCQWRSNQKTGMPACYYFFPNCTSPNQGFGRTSDLGGRPTAAGARILFVLISAG